MELRYISAVCDELRAAAPGSPFRRTFQLGEHALVFDIGASDGRFLFVDAGPSRPRLYLTERTKRELERSSSTSGAFAQYLRKHLANARVTNIEQLPEERIIRFDLSQFTEAGDASAWSLIFQITGRSANIFLLVDEGRIVMSLREDKTEGRRVGDVYHPPERSSAPANADGDKLPDIDGSVSRWLESRFKELDAEAEFRSLAESARRRVKSEIARRTKLAANLRSDLDQHGDAETWKKYGDLLLANTATATRNENGFVVLDFFDEATPAIEIPHLDQKTPAEAAEKYFRRYTKARNARDEIAGRLATVESELNSLRAELAEIETAVDDRDEEFLRAKSSAKSRPQRQSRKSDRTDDTRTYAREFVSSDGF
ncbi:MAG TPA: NFACT family protein, partial [Pyrinomonadaceae bacterium]|nr:NFACT family protein [Pyrinomonadaceae bacterium]